MAFFSGEIDQVLDGKHRLPISTTFRDGIDPEKDGVDYYLTLGLDRHLWLYPDVYFRQMVSKVKTSFVPDRRAVGMDMVFAMARLVKPDGQGRVVIPEKSLQRANIADRVTLVGSGDHIEIWPTDEWEQHLVAQLPGYNELLYRIGEYVDAKSQPEKPA